MTEIPDLSKRHIRSYVLRQGRVSPAQQRACETLLPRFGIAYAAQALDLEQAFGRSAPKILEIGFGMGDSTATIALAHPENDYLALEVHTPGVGNLLKLIDSQQISNIRIIQHDAVEVLRDMIAANTLEGVHIFFPDPWHKARHNKPPFDPGSVHRAAGDETQARRIYPCRHRLAGLRRTGAGGIGCGTVTGKYGGGLRTSPGLSPVHQVRAARYPPGARGVGYGVPSQEIT